MIVMVAYVSQHHMPDVNVFNKDRMLLLAVFIFIVVNLHHSRFLTLQSEFNNLYHYNTIHTNYLRPYT